MASASTVLPDTLRLSLDECVAIALDNNPTVKVADMEIKKRTIHGLRP